MGGGEAHGLGFKPGNNRRMIVLCEYNEMVSDDDESQSPSDFADNQNHL